MYLYLTCFVLAAIALKSDASSLRGMNATISRDLQVDGMKDFVPLSCNSNLVTARCNNWTNIIGTATSFANRVVVPCGQCVTMNAPGPTLTFNGGLEVNGKLVFPDGYRLSLSSTVIVVQGQLDMIASKTVDGIPNIRFTMIGNVDASFTPVDLNARACNGAISCNAGKKGIIVAGGKVNIRGLPMNTPAWTRLQDVLGTSNNPSTILVPSAVIGKWGVGAEILITPHTRVWNQTQTRTIKSINLSGQFAAIELSSTIVRPTTMVESADFAVEVALLSRNIVFEGGADSVASHGGHMMVMNTPRVIQSVEGVDLRNFGQQGNLGRYPIHFHFCGDVAGSLVTKNTIRQSNQRCVVVHGTNKLRIEENVAFDTKGHCYMTEDGMETHNEFIRNLGARTGIPTTIIPNLGPNGDETDGQPATFWISAPTNYFVGNVAAGSEHSGYWFEPTLRGVRASMYPGLDPMYEPLGSFIDNVAHSNTAGKLGAIRMYVPGYFPSTMSSFTGLKVYRNNAYGIFIHRCHNLRVDQSLFADNNFGIDLDRAEGIEVTNTRIIGMSPSYKALMDRQSGVAPVCERGVRTGIDLHTWQKELTFVGAKLSNITISGFGPDPKCAKPTSMKFDDQTLKQGLFEFYTAFERIRLADGLSSIDMCLVNRAEYDLLYLIDLDGSFRPNTAIAATVSSLVASDNNAHMTFVSPTTTCVHNTVGCYSYCYNTCFRSMRYYVDGLGQENYRLRVCSRSNTSKCTLFKGGRRGDVGSHEFVAHLPAGQLYDAVFLDSNGNRIVPRQVQPEIEKTFCSNNLPFDVRLL